MLTKSFHIVALVLLLGACNQRKGPVLAPEYLYQGTDEKVISSLINSKKATIAIIYGNELALHNAQDTLKNHIAGERYIMVTWKQRPMPHWYGTNMNGEILFVETVTVWQGPQGKILFDYQLRPGRKDQAIDSGLNKENRIRLITGQRAAVFPEK